MNWEWDNTLEEILPDTARIDAFLKQLLPGQPVHIVDMMQEILQGNWVMEPMMFWKYIHTYILGYTTEWKKLFISILVLFILCSVITSFLGAFQNTGAAQTAEFLFLLCQLVVLITALQETKSIVTQTMEHMLEFLKLAIPSYMICIAAAGSGLSASVFYKLLLGFICLIEGIVVAGCVPAVEAYMLIGVAESLMGEDRFRGIMEMIKKGILWVLKGLIVLVSGSGILQAIITPVIDKSNLTFMQKSAGALPGIGDIAESITSVTIMSANAVKSSFGVTILLILILIIIIPILNVFMILGTIRLATALGSIAGGQRMLKCTQYLTDAGFLLLRMLVTLSALFFVSIAAITKATSG